jgi:hypothetical protein
VLEIQRGRPGSTSSLKSQHQYKKQHTNLDFCSECQTHVSICHWPSLTKILYRDIWHSTCPEFISSSLSPHAQPCIIYAFLILVNCLIFLIDQIRNLKFTILSIISTHTSNKFQDFYNLSINTSKLNCLPPSLLCQTIHHLSSFDILSSELDDITLRITSTLLAKFFLKCKSEHDLSLWQCFNRNLEHCIS